MKTKVNSPFAFRLLTAALTLLAASGMQASPLTWFPGPPLDTQVSGAATIVDSHLGNVLIGGDSYFNFPENLVVTNASWDILSALPTVQIAAGAAGGGDNILVFGGTDGTSPLNTAINYSPSGDGSTAVASMSVARAYLGYASGRGGSAYAIGGLDASSNVLSSAEHFDQDTTTWSAIASMPSPRYNFPAVFDGTNYIYIFGGYSSTAGPEIATVYRYSISGNNWTELASLPTAVAGSSAAFGADGKIYVVGGVSSGVTLNIVQAYLPAANSWTISTPLPEGLGASAMGVDSLGRLIVMGGTDTNGNDVADVWRSQQLGVPDSAPLLTQLPTTNGAYAQPYSSSIQATGNPQPVYQLVAGPTGMTVDYYTGAINWTPQGVDQIGSIPVTVAATNFAGATNWSYSITITNPRPIFPTGISVVSVTDNSATIAWNPLDPIYGAVTYSLAIPHPYHSPRGSGGGVNYQVIAAGITTNVVTLTGLTPGTSTTYDLGATGPGGSTGFGFNGVGVATTAPQGPTNLWVTALTSTSIGFAWTPSPGPAQSPSYSPIVSYAIMRHNFAANTNIPAVAGLTVTNGAVSGLTPGQINTWYIAGVDAQGYFSPAPYFNYIIVTNPVPVPASLSTGSLSSGAFRFSIQPQSIQTTLIQATANLADPSSWTTIFTNPIGGGQIDYTDTDASSYPARFYRVVSP